MLCAKDITKIYRPKRGVPVTALDRVTLEFPDRGMVFLLGKSGSGKSTLLNVLGGLDRYDGGEITIKGVSSKKFKQSHFDSYRNTYVGFVFQEYNLLNEFTVGANIALAIELQGRKAGNEEINRILRQVDLEGYGARRPNELSGGQLQRVAIARALVKNPQIIMADEPTGALDSVTGKQIFDTLKKLSAQKLVIVVSHDREFAELYADRIIELSDGRVISDLEIDADTDVSVEETKLLEYKGNTISIPSDYQLTEADRIAINEYILKINSAELIIDKKIGIKRTRFKNTDTSSIKHEDETPFRLIKSKLPLKNAFKIGSESLKHKKIRLVVTILLCCIAFGLFGISDTLGAYDHISTSTNSIIDTGIDYAAVSKAKKFIYDGESIWYDYGYKISEEDIRKIADGTGLQMYGVYSPTGIDLSFGQNIDSEASLTETEFDLFPSYFSGFAEITQEIIDELGYKIVAGRVPGAANNEIAVSEYVYEIFRRSGYTDGTIKLNSKGHPELNVQEISSYDDLISKQITVGGVKYTITAIIDTGLDLDRYIGLTEKREYDSSVSIALDYALYGEFDNTANYSMARAIMVGNGSLSGLMASEPPMHNITEGYLYFNADNYSIDPTYLSTFGEIVNKDIVWIDGVKTSLGDKEIIITEEAFCEYGDGDSFQRVYKEDGSVDWAATFKKQDTLQLSGNLFFGDEVLEENGYKIVGVITPSESNVRLQGTTVVSDRVFSLMCDSEKGIYDYAISAMPQSRNEIQKFVSFCYDDEGSVRYPLNNPVAYQLDGIDGVFKEASRIFMYVGFAFAVFAALMMANFIATSIAYKKHEIGILRAIGSRGNDVFRIFFAESFIIAMINFILSAAGVFIVTTIINTFVRNETGLLITVLNFSIRQIVLLFALSIIVAALASFFPVKRIASKRPIDAIRNR